MLSAPSVAEDCIPSANVMAKGLWFTAKQLRWDPDGCSGHLSFILHLLEREPFRRGYLKGSWKVEDFRDIIESYELVVRGDAF